MTLKTTVIPSDFCPVLSADETSAVKATAQTVMKLQARDLPKHADVHEKHSLKQADMPAETTC